MSDQNPDSVTTQDIDLPVMVGDRVHYRESPVSPALAAIVCYVLDDGSLNLCVFDSMGLARPELAVPYSATSPSERVWTLPPRRPR